ncbi:MAG TPA: hypothetical protein VGI39_31675 [Polyangiaceae bacterium]|jgi:hypothetical protein
MGEEAWEISQHDPPAGLDIHVERDAGGLTLWIDPPPLGALLREALLPPILILLLTAVIAFAAYEAVRFNAPFLLAVVAYGVWKWITALRDLRQNAGIVTSIEVRGDWLTWRKKQLWGESEQRWDLRTVRSAEKKNFMLKIAREKGVPMGAFSYRNGEGLEWVCRQLNAAIVAAQARLRR